MSSSVTVADLFCGAGGTSSGAQRAIRDLGAEMDLVAVNHWPVAVDTHQRNHPQARHYVQDLENADPEDLVPDRQLDILLASPECRYYSRARGGKPVGKQGRMAPWTILHWLSAISVRLLIVENVPEFAHWGPLDRNGRPLRKQAGKHFLAWVNAIRNLGYTLDWRTLNAADYGDATSRTRLFVLARNDGFPVRWPEPTHSSYDGQTMWGNLPHWRSAREIIDWEDTGLSLLDHPRYQKRPLSLNTRRRIAKGLMKFGGLLADLYIRLLDLPDALACDADGETERFVISKRLSGTVRGMNDPVPTITAQTGGGVCLVTPTAAPTADNCAIIEYYGTSDARSIDSPLSAVLAVRKHALMMPSIIEYYGHGSARDIAEPLSTVTTKARHALATPAVIAVNHGNGYQGDAGNDRRVYGLDQPLCSITTSPGLALSLPTIDPVVDAGADDVDPRRLVYLDGQPYILDIRFRMLKNEELARAMGFSDAEQEYEFAGTKTDITRQIGNAVPVQLAAALVRAMLAPSEDAL